MDFDNSSIYLKRRVGFLWQWIHISHAYSILFFFLQKKKRYETCL